MQTNLQSGEVDKYYNIYIYIFIYIYIYICEVGNHRRGYSLFQSQFQNYKPILLSDAPLTFREEILIAEDPYFDGVEQAKHRDYQSCDLSLDEEESELEDGEKDSKDKERNRIEEEGGLGQELETLVLDLEDRLTFLNETSIHSQYNAKPKSELLSISTHENSNSNSNQPPSIQTPAHQIQTNSPLPLPINPSHDLLKNKLDRRNEGLPRAKIIEINFNPFVSVKEVPSPNKNAGNIRNPQFISQPPPPESSEFLEETENCEESKKEGEATEEPSEDIQEFLNKVQKLGIIPHSMFREIRRMHHLDLYSEASTIPALKFENTILLPRVKQPKQSNKTLFLDLDGTLIYSPKHDIIGKKSKLTFLTKRHKYWFNMRPFAFELLKNLHTIYEIVIYTSAEDLYARDILRIIDPKKMYYDHILSKKHCFSLGKGGQYRLKDLNLITNRKLQNEVIVDNSILPCMRNIDNLVPVKSFEGNDEGDKELILISTYLSIIAQAPDVRSCIINTIGLRKQIDKYRRGLPPSKKRMRMEEERKVILEEEEDYIEEPS